MVRKTVLAAAAAAALFAVSPLRAAEPAAAEPDRAPLMALLNEAGLAQPLEKANINIFGHAQAGYTYNFDGADRDNFGRVFDTGSNELLGNQLGLIVERTVDVSKKEWDLGGRMEWLYGTDAQYIHANGLFDDESGDYQIDLVQLYADVSIPIGNGLLVRAGKIVTLLGWETINPTTNLFYSHSYLFGFAIPFTHTGVMASYRLNDNWLVEGGVFRGWEQAFDDNNDAISYHAKLAYTSSDEKLGVIAQFVTGPEQDDNESDYRTVFDFQISYAVTEKLSLGVNADIGFEEDTAPDGGTARWYGIANYASYKINDVFTLNGRGEWFRDDDGTRIGVAANFYEVTLGLGITPFPNDKVMKNLLIRPEIRADFADDPVFNDETDSEMYTAAVDVIFTF